MQPPFFRYQLQYWLQTQFQTQFQTQLRRVELERPRIERALGMQMSSDACSASTRIGSAGRCRRLRRPERPRSHRDCRIARDCVPLIGFLPVLPAGCAVFCSFFPSSCLSFLRVRLPILLSLFASLRLSLSLLVSPCLSLSLLVSPPVRRSAGQMVLSRRPLRRRVGAPRGLHPTQPVGPSRMRPEKSAGLWGAGLP